MATTKKATAKTKVSTKKSTAAHAKKRPVTKSAAAARKKSTPTTQQSSFMTLTPTIQTFYWFILGAVVIFLTMWVASLSIKIQSIYDQIETTNAETLSVPAKQPKQP